MSYGLDDLSLFELFRMEAEDQVRVLSDRLVEVEKDPTNASMLQALMRAAHSLKGAARIIGLDGIVDLTHAMEDRMVAAQKGKTLAAADVDRLLQATDLLAKLQAVEEADVNAWLEEHAAAIATVTASFAGGEADSASSPNEAEVPAEPAANAPPKPDVAIKPDVAHALPVAAVRKAEIDDEERSNVFSDATADRRQRERSVRIASSGFDRILSFASHVLVASRQFIEQAEAIERARHDMVRTRNELADADTEQRRTQLLQELDRQLNAIQNRVAEFDGAAASNQRAAERLHRSVLEGRLRPFSEGVSGLPRLVRETARELGKQVELEITGETVRVDRDILEKLESPLTHLVTNAIDHGTGTAAERLSSGKPAAAKIRLHARHENGRLVITVRDDGKGIHRDALREKIIARDLVTAQTAESLSDAELLEFIFLPGFSTRDTVSQTSGRGVGLNVVQSMVHEAGGSVTVTSEEGVGTTFRLTLPVTQSVLRVIRVQIDGETYAIPLARIDRVMEEVVERETDEQGVVSLRVAVQGERVVAARLADLLGFAPRELSDEPQPIVVTGGAALVVDRFVDELEVHVRRLDRRLGKIPGVSAASLDEEGQPLLILDVEDILQTMRGESATSADVTEDEHAKILVVDDSHTVRELVRRMLVGAGYHVTTAQNGQEAWNMLRLRDYDLLISDVDMPVMNGIELVGKVRENPRLMTMPVIILSYKDSSEDRSRGMEAGADYYLTKGSFKNDTFLNAVVDLIGTAEWKGSEQP